jgi:hypothetical protein
MKIREGFCPSSRDIRIIFDALEHLGTRPKDKVAWAASKGSTMDPYDSDSSGFEEDDRGEFTETSVLLGFVSEEPVDDSISHLGGWPV